MLTFLEVWAFQLTGSGIKSEGGGDCADSSCTGFDICQNAEGTGYDNSETPHEEVVSGGEVNEDDTTATVLRGSQQIKILGAGSASSRINFPGPNETSEFTARSTLWLHFRVKMADVTPSGINVILNVFNTSSGVVAQLDMRTTNDLRIYNGSSYTTTSDNNLFTDATKKHVWVKYVKGTGSNGVTEVYLSNNGTRPASATYSITNGNATTDAVRIRFNEYNGVTGGMYIDQIIARGTEIGDVCD